MENLKANVKDALSNRTFKHLKIGQAYFSLSKRSLESYAKQRPHNLNGNLKSGLFDESKSYKLSRFLYSGCFQEIDTLHVLFFERLANNSFKNMTVVSHYHINHP
jgi:hypothetical protein